MDEEVIAIMGATGVGKSSLIKLVTEDDSIVVGHGLTSETQSITSYPFVFGGRHITLVDTPGFDDTYRSDGDVLQSLVQWLTSTYQNGCKLSAIIYLHRITDVRLQGSSVRNLRVFQELCGPDFSSYVVLCASFWSDAPGEQEIQRQRIDELTSTNGMWNKMISGGSRVFKESLTRRSAIRMIFEMIGSSRGTMQVQREVVDEHKPIQESSAVSQLMSLELERQEQDHIAKMAELKKLFEERINMRERTHSENLELMRRAFEEKLAASEALNAQVRAEIEVIDVQSRPKIARKSVPPALNRASTTAVDPVSINHEATMRRKLRYINFSEHMTATIRLLENERSAGRVKCNWDKQKSCYMMVCTNCLRNIGSNFCYKCVACSDCGDFVLCQTCYDDDAVHCNDGTHLKIHMPKGMANITGTQCPRVRSPPQDSPLLCGKCSTDVGRCYLHCCACAEKFDMCVQCAVQGKHCPGNRAFGRHKLEICARYVGL